MIPGSASKAATNRRPLAITISPAWPASASSGTCSGQSVRRTSLARRPIKSGSPLISALQRKDSVRRRPVTHETADASREVSLLVQRPGQPAPLGSVLILHEPVERPPQLRLVARHAGLLQCEGDETGRVPVASGLQRRAVGPFPFADERRE